MLRFVFTLIITMLTSTLLAQGVVDVHSQNADKMIVRLAEIEVYPQYLTEYLEFANEVDRLSVEREPGVICLFPMHGIK